MIEATDYYEGNRRSFEFLSNNSNSSSSNNSDLARDQLRALLEAEESYHVPAIPCLHVGQNKSLPLAEWRRKISQWAFRVIDHFRLDREIVCIGMNLVDRFLVLHHQDENGELANDYCVCPSCKRSLDSQNYQLAAMTSIFLAVKLHSENGSGTRRRAFKLTTFVELSRGQFSAKDICQMEQTLLDTLQWRVSPPTPMTFVSYLVTLMPDRDLLPFKSQTYYDLVIHVLRELSRYLTELAVCIGGTCSHHKPSQIAFASILVSMDLLTLQALPPQARLDFCRTAQDFCGLNCQESPIPQLKSVLQRALWPEMLLEDTDELTASESGHPISIARDYGLLDLNRIARQRVAQQATSMSPSSCPAGGRTPPGSPRGHIYSLEVSPVSVAT